MTVVVTGASGFIGRNLVAALIRKGRKVRALDLEPVASELIGEEHVRRARVEQVIGDVLSPAMLHSAFEGADVVYHLAARVSICGDRDGGVRRTNAEGTRNVVSACRAAGVRRLVHFSSIHALDPNPFDRAVDEQRALYHRPGAQPYESSKASAEVAVLAGVSSGLDAVIVNPTGVLGPYDYGPTPQGRALLMMMHGKAPLIPAGGFNWIDVRDVVCGALSAEARGRRGERYLLSGEWISLPELAELFTRAAGVAVPRLVLPMWAARALGWGGDAYTALTGWPAPVTTDAIRSLSHYRDVRRAKAERELGFVPRPLAETVADTVAWFRASGMLREPRRSEWIQTWI